MVLGSPGALWWLLLLPVVILLYMLRARRQAQVVPSTLLWERATRDLVARRPVRRLERSVLLLLQLLAVTALALALARPSITLPGLAADAVVFVVKTGASMQATDDAPSRFAVARGEALALLARLGPRQQAALVEAGRRPRLAVDFTLDRALLADAIRGLRPTDVHSALDEAVALAGGLRAGGRPAQVHVFADRAPQDPRARWHRVGRGAPNAAIVAASARRDAQGRVRVLVHLEAFGGDPGPRTLAVEVGGRPLARRPVARWTPPSQVVMLDLGDASGIAAIRLEGRDALGADDRAVLALGQAALPRVLVAGAPNPVLDAVLGAVPTAGVARTEGLEPAGWPPADLVVLDGVPPAPLPPGAYLLIGTVGTNLPVQVTGALPDQEVRTMAATHPVARLADLRGVRVAGGIAIQPQAGTVVAEGNAPLVWAYEGRGIRAVVLPFALAQSDLALHPAFPILMANAVAWLYGGPHVAPGDAPAAPAGRWRQATLTDPGGETATLAAQDGAIALPPLERVGVYRFRADGWERRYLVSAVDRRESDLRVDPAPPPAAAGGAPQTASLPLTPWLLGLAGALLVGEWVLWMRTLPGAGSARRPA